MHKNRFNSFVYYIVKLKLKHLYCFYYPFCTNKNSHNMHPVSILVSGLIIVNEEQKRTEEDGWWNLLYRQDTDTAQTTSFTKSGFYLLLWQHMCQDFMFLFECVYECVYYAVFVIQQYLHSELYEHKIAVLLIFFLVIAGVLFSFYLFQKCLFTKNIKSTKNRSRKAAKSHKNCENSDICDPSCSHYGKRFYIRVLSGVLVLGFLLSIPWEFVRLYQSMVAEKVAQMSLVRPILILL